MRIVLLTIALAASGCGSAAPSPSTAPTQGAATVTITPETAAPSPQPELAAEREVTDDDLARPWFEAIAPASPTPTGHAAPTAAARGPICVGSLAIRHPGTTSCHLLAELLLREIRAHHSELDACRVAFQRRKPGASGQMRVSFLITLSGDVPGACSRGAPSLDDEALLCVAAAMTRRTFSHRPSKSCGANTVSYPLYFSP
jgi:outer membrane biosynthesis protein TonB